MLLAWFKSRIPKRYLHSGYSRLSSAESSGRSSGESFDYDSALDPSEKMMIPSSSLWADWLGCLQVLRPSFLQQHHSGRAKKLHPSAWLDGLRGVAAFFVVWHHASLLWFDGRIHNGYGSTDENRLFIQLPIIRLIVSGNPQVMIFFVISGYALSYKPLKLARQGRWADFNDALASSAFRRHSRLYMPALVTTFLSMLMAWMGWYGKEGWGGVANSSRRPPELASLWSYIFDWAFKAVRLTDPLSKDMGRGGNNPYDLNLWTLPFEFDSSLVVFLTLAAFSRLRPNVRLLLLFAVVTYAAARTYWHVFLFISGTFMCDLKFYLEGIGPQSSNNNESILPEHSPRLSPQQHGGLLSAPSPSEDRPSAPKVPGFAKIFWTTSFVLSLFVLSIPPFTRGARDTPGYRTLTTYLPPQYSNGDYFFIPVAAACLVFTIDRAPWLQAIFNHPFPQYLAKISYSLYLVHGPLLWTLGWHLAKRFVDLTGRETNEQYCLGIALSAAFFWPVAIWAADLVCRLVDTKAVDFGRWAYDRLIRRGEEQGSPAKLY